MYTHAYILKTKYIDFYTYFAVKWIGITNVDARSSLRTSPHLYFTKPL